MRQASTNYIRIILEYNNIVWKPRYVHRIDLVENVQRNFTKRTPSHSQLYNTLNGWLCSNLTCSNFTGLVWPLLYSSK